MSNPTFEARTTAGAGANRLVRGYVIPLWSSSDLGTIAYPPPLDEFQWDSDSIPTKSGYPERQVGGDLARDTGAAVSELRRLTGFTWDQLAKLFNVARRSLHFWASGKSLNAANEEQLFRMLAVVHKIDRGSAGENRTLLLTESRGKMPFDLLARGKYSEVEQLLGAGLRNPRKAIPRISPGAFAARMPRRPDELIDALQDRVQEKDNNRRPKGNSQT